MKEEGTKAGASNRLVLKDFISIAVFKVIYIVATFIIGMPLAFLVLVTYLMYPFVTAIFTGVIGMFFLAKVQKPFALFIFIVLSGAIMTIMGHTIIVFLHSLIVGIFAEVTRKALGYKTLKGNIACYSVLSLDLVGSFWEIFLMKEQYYNMMSQSVGKVRADQAMALPMWIMAILYASCIVGAIMGGFLGAKILKKHFVKAGIV